MKKLKEKAKKGFSLIELMVVIAIIAVLAAIALPLYMGYICKTQANESLNALRETKYTWAMLRSVTEFDHPDNHYGSADELMQTMSIQLPSRNWDYFGHNITADNVDVHVTAIGPNLKACLTNPPLEYDYRVFHGSGEDKGVIFSVINSTDERFMPNLND